MEAKAAAKKENILGRTWAYLKRDTWDSWLVSIILVFVVIKFVFFPGLSLITGTSLPLVVIESCSMYHGTNFDDWWFSNGVWYENNDISKEEFLKFSAKNGMNKGDIIITWGRGGENLGNVIIFKPVNSAAKYPIIHRVVKENPLATKGDHNLQQLTPNNNLQNIDETSISQEQVIGKSVFRIPLVGWIKLIFFEPFKSPEQRGLCG